MSDHTEPTQDYEAVKVGKHVMIKDRPCKVIEVNKSKPGKHGSAKLAYFGVDIFTDNKLQGTDPAHATVQVPIINRVEYQLIDIDDEDYLSLMDSNGEMKEDLTLPNDDIGKDIQQRLEDGQELNVTVMSACGQERVVNCKEIINND